MSHAFCWHYVLRANSVNLLKSLNAKEENTAKLSKMSEKVKYKKKQQRYSAYFTKFICKNIYN